VAGCQPSCQQGKIAIGLWPTRLKVCEESGNGGMPLMMLLWLQKRQEDGNCAFEIIVPRQLLGFLMDSGEGRAAFEWICIRYIMVDVET
jgi:hypothetical protein